MTKETFFKPGELVNEILADYRPGLGSYLDEKGLHWEQISLNHVGTFIKITFPWGMSHGDVFEFAIDFTEWRDKHCRE